MIKNLLTSAVAGLALLSAPATMAQTAGQEGLVTVNLQNVLNNLARDLKIDRTNIPVTAQVPVQVAANVCGVSVNVLSRQAGGTNVCTAKTSSQELAQAVQQQMSAGGTTVGNQTGAGAGTSGSGTQAGTGAATGTTAGMTGTTAGVVSGTTAGASTGASASAPGQIQKNTDATAREAAPGQQKKPKDKKSARDEAPGQQPR